MSWQRGVERRFTRVLERGHWCHPGCWCNGVPHSGGQEEQPPTKTDRHALGTLSTKLNAPSNFMHTLGNDCFSLGLVQIPRPSRPSLSFFATLFARLVSYLIYIYIYDYSRIIGMEDENTSIISFRREYRLSEARLEGDICVCIFPPRL